MTSGNSDRLHPVVGSFHDELKRLEAEAARRGYDFLAHLIGVAASEAAEVEKERPGAREGSIGG